MNHPLLIGFASIIPGLGFVILNRYRSAALMFSLVVGFLLLSGFSRDQYLNGMFFALALGFWIMQFSTSVRVAKTVNSKDKNYSTVDLQEFKKVQAPSELTRREKLHFKIRETLQQQVKEDEALIECISGTRGKFGGAYYLGLSNKHFLISELDMFSNPLYTMQVDFSAIEDVQNKGRVIENILVVRIRGEKVKKFEIPNLFKDQLSSIVKILEEKTA
jgi:hypothetical protein